MYTYTTKQKAAFDASRRAWEARQVHWDSRCTCNGDCHMAIAETFFRNRATRLWKKVDTWKDRHQAFLQRQAEKLSAWHNTLDEIIRQV